MSTAQWLRSRKPPPPEPLASRVLMQASACEDGFREPHEVLAAAALQTLSAILARRDQSRTVATDLLVADALVTYACEAAVERWQNDSDEEKLSGWCAEFASRIAGTRLQAYASARS